MIVRAWPVLPLTMFIALTGCGERRARGGPSGDPPPAPQPDEVDSLGYQSIETVLKGLPENSRFVPGDPTNAFRLDRGNEWMAKH